jgi:hypothetical protein
MHPAYQLSTIQRLALTPPDAAMTFTSEQPSRHGRKLIHWAP